MASSPETNTPMQRERKKPGRVPTSCAECRRLKLRCDRKVPCETCIKRGCGAICPTGSLTLGKGNRLILTNTAELHDKVDSMSARIRVLEEALQRAHGQTSNDPHPLLSGATSLPSQNSGQTSVDSAPAAASSSSEPETDSVIDAFGTLTIGTRGETSFMSSTARTEYLIGVTLIPPSPYGTLYPFVIQRPFEKSPTWATLIQSSRLPSRVIEASVLEQDVTTTDIELRQIVMDHRPPFQEAVRLCEVYLEWGRTLWYPLKRHELFDEVLASVYRANSYEQIPGPHSLALLFSVFALASLYDFSRPAHCIEAFEYYILSRVALEFTPPCTTTTLQAIIVVEHNLQWHHLSDVQTDPSRTYVLIGFGVKLAYRMGLHLRGTRFQLDRSAVQKRSALFWQLFLTDTLLSFYAGRPPSFSLDWIDVLYPDEESPVTNDKGEIEIGWHSWTWRFAKLLHEILVSAFGAKIPTYGNILELDRKVRDFPIPSRLQLQRVRDTHAEPPIILQQLLVLVSKEQVLLNIHRRYFSQALQDSPNDLLKHKYGPSVMATYRSAWRLIVGLSSAVDWIPDIVARVPIFWSLAFSAAVVMCMIVTRAPSSNMAASSLHEINVVYEVFKKAALSARNASILLEYVERLWHKSRENHHSRSECILSRAELDRVGGGSTRVISKSNDGTSHSDCPNSSPCPSKSLNDIGATNSSLDLSSVHPRIMQDMQSFDGFRASSTPTGGIDFVTPEKFSLSMIDTQLSQFCLEAEKAKAQQALNTPHSSLPGPFYLQGGAYAPDIPFDPALRNFMEQLGF